MQELERLSYGKPHYELMAGDYSAHDILVDQYTWNQDKRECLI